MANRNFKWLTNDIDSSLVLKVVYNINDNEEEYAIYNVIDVIDVTGDEIEVETANIDDLTNFLTIGIVRFSNVSDMSDILDIPFRKLYKLYENGNVLGDNTNRLLSFSSLDIFSIIDGAVGNDYLVFSVLVGEVSGDLKEIMKIASEFGSYGMQEKFDAMTKVTMINHRRLVSDIKNG